MDIVEELRQRRKALEPIMTDMGLDAIALVGNSAVGPIAYGCLRYFTDHRTYYHLQAVVARPGKPMAICIGSILHLEGVQNKGFEDIRISPDILGSVLKILSEQKVSRVGVPYDALPYDWELAMKKEFPGIELVDVTDAVFALRNVHSPHEVECIKTCAKIADAGYAAVLETARPGVRMSDVHAALDYAMKRAGAEETFTLMSNGVFSYDNNQMPCIQSFSWPDDRVIREGENIGMEISPKYNGYWSQIVRTVCVGEMNPELQKAHALQLEAIDYTIKLLKPGVKLGDVLKAMWEFTIDRGYIPKLPFGHIMGLDLDEGGRGSLDSPLVIPENAAVVLHPTMVLGDMDYGIFWGDPFLVTKEGGIRLTESSTELPVL